MGLSMAIFVNMASALMSMLPAEPPQAVQAAEAPVEAAQDQTRDATPPGPAAAASPVVLTRDPMPKATPLAFADLSDEEVFARAADALEQIDTLKARFVQLSPSGAEMTGTVSLDRPGRLRFDYDAPIEQLVVAAGGLVYVHDAELETTDSYPVSETPLRFLLSDRLDRGAAVLKQVFRTETGVAIYVSPADEALQGELGLTFTYPDMQLVEWAVFEPTGDVTQVALRDVERDVRLPGRLFRVPESSGLGLRDDF